MSNLIRAIIPRFNRMPKRRVFRKRKLTDIVQGQYGQPTEPTAMRQLQDKTRGKALPRLYESSARQMTDEQLVEHGITADDAMHAGNFILCTDYYAPTGNGDTFGYVCMKCRKERGEGDSEDRRGRDGSSLQSSSVETTFLTAELLEGAMVALAGQQG